MADTLLSLMRGEALIVLVRRSGLAISSVSEVKGRYSWACTCNCLMKAFSSSASE